MKLVSRFASIALVIAMAVPALAQKVDKPTTDKPAAKAKDTASKDTASKDASSKETASKKAKPAEAGKRAAVAHPLLKAVEGLTLTAEQKPKIEAATQEYTEAILALRKEGFTQALNKKKADAAKAAREAGKKGKELETAIMATIDATDEEKALLKKADEATAKLQKNLSTVLTAEQVETLPAQMQQALGGKKPAPKKKPA